MAIQSSLVSIPSTTLTVDQRFLIEPLKGSQHPLTYLDRFPDEVYNKSLDSHLVKFLYSLLGPSGISWLRKNIFDARLLLEERGFELFQLDRFYGNPFSLGRVFDEIYEEDPYGMIPRADWDRIRARDEKFRNRALDFFNGVRMGNTPFGMRLVAKSGLGHDVEIVENYKYLFDLHADNSFGVKYYGQTNSTEEMVVLPRQEKSRSEEQTFTITWDPDDGVFPTGTFVLVFDERASSTLDHDATIYEVQEALRSIPIIGEDGVMVTGGPLPEAPITIRFTGPLSNKDVPRLQVIGSWTGTPRPTLSVETLTGGIESIDEVVNIPETDKHHLQVAVDRLRPVATIPTVYNARGLRTRQNWTSISSSSEFYEVTRYVSGNPNVKWPERDGIFWIEKSIEREAPRAKGDLQYHYQGFHDIDGIISYTEDALEDVDYENDATVLENYKSEHAGRFGAGQRSQFDFLKQFENDTLIFSIDRIAADYAEPVTTTYSTWQTPESKFDSIQLINGIYPLNYSGLPGVPELKYKEEQFWASRERTEGAEYIEIDLGSPRAVNYLTFEISKKPLDIEISYDLLDQSPRRIFHPVTPITNIHWPNSTMFSPEEENYWDIMEYNFTNSQKEILFTRFIRIKVSRRITVDQPFLFDPITETQFPWSVEIKNLRIGRNVSNS